MRRGNYVPAPGRTPPDLVFQISGGASIMATAGGVPSIEQAIEKSKKIAWCRTNARISGQPALLEITVEVKVVSDYSVRSVVPGLIKALCTFALGQTLFSAVQPGIVSLVEPVNLIHTCPHR